MPRPSSRPTGQVWRLLDAWARDHPLKPDQTGIASALEVSTSLLSNWKFMDTPLQTEHMLRIVDRLGIDYDELAKAAAADNPTALLNRTARRSKQQSQGQALRAEQDAAGQENQDSGSDEPA